MHYSNQYSEAISTVQLSPFNEGQWHRLTTYPTGNGDGPDLTLLNHQLKPSSARLNAVGPIDINILKTDDALLLDEIHAIKKIALKSALSLRRDQMYSCQSGTPEHGKERPTTSPTDEYERSSDFFYQTRELTMSYLQLQEKQQAAINSQPNSSAAFREGLPHLLSPKKVESPLKVQLQQSTQVRESTMAALIDRRILTPLSVNSTKRAVGAIAQPTYRQRTMVRSFNIQTPRPNDESSNHRSKEQTTDTNSATSSKQLSARQRSVTRASMHLLRTRNQRTKDHQKTELKSAFVKPCRQPILSDCLTDDTIPNSIEIMRRLGGPVTAFEHHLRHVYQRQLTQFRNGSVQC